MSAEDNPPTPTDSHQPTDAMDEDNPSIDQENKEHAASQDTATDKTGSTPTKAESKEEVHVVDRDKVHHEEVHILTERSRFVRFYYVLLFDTVHMRNQVILLVRIIFAFIHGTFPFLFSYQLFLFNFFST